METWIESHSTIVLLIVFAGVWALVCKILSLGGWNSLAEQYMSTAAFTGKKWPMQSARIGWIGYNSCSTFGVNGEELFMSAMILFRVGHPSLTIPLADVTGQNRKGLLFHYVDLSFAKAPRVNVRIYKGLAEKLEAGSGGNWKYARA